MIEVEHLSKWFGGIHAVDDLNFQVPAGQVLGFLGPNGAGKSTTLRMLTGYLPPSSGRVTVDGHDVVRQFESARRKIGYLPESTPLYPEMRVEDYLHYRGRLMKMDRATRRQRIDLVCERCGLSANRRRIIGHLSKGNRQRVGVAQTLLHDPPLLVLDEPTAGLDPNQITHFRDLIDELRGRHTVLISTHILTEVERTADQVMIIAGGRVVAQGQPQELRASIAGQHILYLEVKAAEEALLNVLIHLPGVRKVEVSTAKGWSVVKVRPEGKQDVREAVGQAIAKNGWVIREMRWEGASLEEFFMRITAAQAHRGDEEPPAARRDTPAQPRQTDGGVALDDDRSQTEDRP